MKKFKLGQKVLVRKNASFLGQAGAYMIVKVLPNEGGVQKYRVKSENEAFERTISEGGLEAME